ncbi:MAG: hypothetical protein R6U50_18505 [Desulfobacterales bacterium]
MDVILKAIISNLNKKGLSRQEIPRFIKDFCRIIDRQGNSPNVAGINLMLENLGWRNSIADYYLLELMTDLRERHGDRRIDELVPPFQLQFRHTAKVRTV